MTGAENHDLVEQASPFPFEATLERLTQAIEKAGLTIFARIDHAANARDVGLTMPPATVLIYGAAKAGTPIMLASPLAALDLPMRVLARAREDGGASIAFHPVAALLGRAGVSSDIAARLEPAQRLLLAALAP
jgi:uncharacterized protein (DUF302 family)